MLLSKGSYLIGILAILVGSYSQYFIGGPGAISELLVVYGIPILVTSLIYGSVIVQRAFKNTYRAVKFGLGFFGGFTVLGTIVAVAIYYIIAILQPSSLNLLNRPNPVLNIPPEVAGIMVFVSLLIIGPAEEYLFRGYVYGGLLGLSKDRHWLSLAFVSSIIFAIMHLYYAIVYQITSLIQFTDLVAFGMAMALTYYLSGGNLLVPALIHGAYDATGFLSVAISSDLGSTLRGLLVLAGIVIGLGVLIQDTLRKRRQTQSISF